ncbi:cytochrome b/b6 domain-containing protein [Pseudoalteromonas piscicida]|uniref:Cytochrome B n=1 Tax=Pseudoalteromonas piscicida TaxID=43662 RepID=A0A2A5JUU0_PSEO7|nr:cytochrome b/b6 domain-containing protein [Pseudoalteromonas piscicida]PCK33170.1 cytochrome B [Pseudoalteromonas piscicida]
MNREAIKVWSAPIRVFHWVNVIAILLLIVIGLIILNGKTLGITSDGKVLLKTLHVTVGYVFALNLFVRLIFGLIGSGYERFGKMLPFYQGFSRELMHFFRNKDTVHKGHNPAGKLMIAAMLLLMSVQAASGLILAGTDIYYPPFGNYFAKSIAVDQAQVQQIRPYSKENVNVQKYKAMRAFRKPFITAHVYAFYGLLILIPLHVAGVIVAERREKSALVSGMISGIKYLPKKPKE